VQRLELHVKATKSTVAYTPPLCSYDTIFYKHRPPAWDIVGQTYSRTVDVSHTFTYSVGANSSLGIAISASAAGGFSADAGATSSATSSATTNFPTYGNYTGVYYKTEFAENEYSHQCMSIVGRGSPSKPYGPKWYTSKSVGQYGGEDTRTLHTYPNATQCSKYLPNPRGFTKDTTTAWEWSDGLTLPYFNVSVSTTTGYTSDASVTYIVSHTTRYLCGINGGPAQTPGQIVAGRP
jgi:hypothetical protein